MFRNCCNTKCLQAQPLRHPWMSSSAFMKTVWHRYSSANFYKHALKSSFMIASENSSKDAISINDDKWHSSFFSSYHNLYMKMRIASSILIFEFDHASSFPLLGYLSTADHCLHQIYIQTLNPVLEKNVQSFFLVKYFGDKVHYVELLNHFSHL